jgi:hypothetical protein
MLMALKEQLTLARDEGFMERVLVAMCAVAIQVQAEPPSTANHANRAAYAKLVLNDPEHYTALFSLAICANDATLTSGSPDSAIQTGISAVWNALAGTI